MKKVRFRTPSKDIYKIMDESECQSPRPFVERQHANQPDIYQPQRLVYSSDPVKRYESSDSSPYPLAKKTVLPAIEAAGSNWIPSKDLNLSMLDCHESRTPCKPNFQPVASRPVEISKKTGLQFNVLASIDNNHVTPPNVLSKVDSFFIRRDNLDKYSLSTNPIEKQFYKHTMGKENEPFSKKSEITKTNLPIVPTVQGFSNNFQRPLEFQNQKQTENYCNCHHCKKPQAVACTFTTQPARLESPCLNVIPTGCQCEVTSCCKCEHQVQNMNRLCKCTQSSPISPMNAVDKKTWTIEKYEQSKKGECMEVEKQTNVMKEKREPTISDLLKIIKLQNEQLQLLQDKVDKFISTSNNQPQIQSVPVQNYMTEHVSLQTIDTEHKISIGVMTSFEMVRTSTVINKGILTQTTDNAQIQCNKSQISIKEVVSKPVNLNFLDGIMPMSKKTEEQLATENLNKSLHETRNANLSQGNMNEEKTLNDLSLYNVQVDNVTTPLMSPEQSLYLDVRDYSGSDSSDDQSNVGWTYYNKVMTHVNGMLQDSDMPSSASALYRNTRQHCVQMQIDKTNVSVTKRVKFGDDPLGIHQPHLYAASTDTSLKMNQLAAKYLKAAPAPQHILKPTTAIDVSFATKNYMERHKLLQGTSASRSPPPGEIPRFLDITALKQQTKLL